MTSRPAGGGPSGPGGRARPECSPRGPSTSVPDVPAVAETIPGFAAETWFGLVAPAGTPHDILAKLNAETRRDLAVAVDVAGAAAAAAAAAVRAAAAARCGVGSSGVAGGSRRAVAGPTGDPQFRAAVSAAPRRIGCAYRLAGFSAAPGFDATAWLPGDIMTRFFQAS